MDGSLASFGLQSTGDKNVATRAVKTIKTLVVECAGGDNFDTVYDIAGNFIFFDFDDCATTFGLPVAGSLATYAMQFSVMGEDGRPTDPMPFSQGTKFRGEFKGVSFKFGNLPATKFRVIYGYDFDFDTPIKQIGVTRAQNSGLTVQIAGTVQGVITSFQSTVLLGAGGVENIVANTANVSGIFVQHAAIGSQLGAAAGLHSLVGKNGAVAPGGPFDGTVIHAELSGTAFVYSIMNYPKTIQAGRRFDRINGAGSAQTTAYCSVDYKANMPL